MAKEFTVTKPVFYADTATIKELLDYSAEKPKPGSGFDLTLEITDAPFWSVLHSLKTRNTMKTYIRFSPHMPYETGAELGKVTEARRGELDIIGVERFEETMATSYIAAIKICEMVQKEFPDFDLAAAKSPDPESMTNKYDLPEANYAGFVIRKASDKWQMIPVQGKERPDLMADDRMCRPYLEDTMFTNPEEEEGR